MIDESGVENLRRIIWYAALCLILIIPITGCSGKEKTVTFSAEIQEVSEHGILVKTINYKGFDKASVDLTKADYDFDPEAGQTVAVTILPEIKESYPVQVTGVKLVLKGEAEKKVADYFPFRSNVKYTYEGKGNEFAGYEVYTDYTSKDRIQQDVENGGTVTARVYEVKGGKLIRTLSRGEIYYRENMLGQTDATEEVLLMEPLKKGTSWKLKDGGQRTITGLSTKIETPMGTFSTIEVITENDDGTTIDYYARNIGLVKTIFQSGGMEVSSALTSVEENAARKQTVKFYYPDTATGKIRYQEKEVAFHTNDETGKVLEEAYKSAVSDVMGVVLPTDAAIKSLSLDDKKRVHVDFNSAFSTDMNAGAAYETMILQSVADTFGNYYGTEEVILTVEGKPYESGNIKMQQDQTIPVKLEIINQKEQEDKIQKDKTQEDKISEE
jgi:Sporulation and spore germination.